MPTRLIHLCLLALCCLVATPAHAVLRTTTDFFPPSEFGLALDGRLFSDSPYPNLEVTEVRLYWDVEVAEGFDASQIEVSIVLPIGSTSTQVPWLITPVFDLSGPTLGWAGSGTFNHMETYTAPNLVFGDVGTGWGWTSTYNGSVPPAPNALHVLPTTRIEIDYIVPPQPGDLSDDGDIDDEDLGLMFSAFTGPDLVQGPLTNPAADLSGDGDVDDEDLGLLFAAFTGPLAPASVPEPSSLALLGLGVLLGLRRR